jgi:transposase
MAAVKGPRKVRQYTAEFKLKAVELSQIEGVHVQDVASALEIHPFMLSKWRKEVREGLIKARVSVAPEARRQREVREVAKLRGELALLREEHELLKKAIRFCSAQRARFSRSSNRSRTGST